MTENYQIATIQKQMNEIMKKCIYTRLRKPLQLPPCLSWSPRGARNDGGPSVFWDLPRVRPSAMNSLRRRAVPTLLLLRAPGETSHTNLTPIFFFLVCRVCIYVCTYPRTPAEPSPFFSQPTPQRRRGEARKKPHFLQLQW
jgi:hypothetical protein